MRTIPCLCLAAAVLPACIASTGDLDELDPSETATVAQEIRNGSPVTSSMGDYVVQVGGCTGTIIGPRHILSAAHCGSIDLNDRVGFYNPTSAGSGGPDYRARVLMIYMPVGVTNDDHQDADGDWADYQVLYLDTEIPSYAKIALLSPHYPGDNTTIYQVGRGDHDGDENEENYLRWRTETIRNKDDDNGRFDTKNYTTNDGDSGGPAFTWETDVGYVVQGALWGSWFVDFSRRTRYTSVPHHQDDIMRYAGHVGKKDYAYPGNNLNLHANITYNTCRSLCMQNTECQAYTWYPGEPLLPTLPAISGTCYEKSDKGSSGGTSDGSRSGYKKSTGTCNVWSDGVCRG